MSSTVSSVGVLNIPSRMERLPVTRFTWKVVLLAGLAWFIESLSIGSLGVALGPLKQVMHLGVAEIGVLTAASTFGIVLGLIPAGFLSDRFGRKQLLVWGIVEYSVLTLLCALAPNFSSLLVFRFLSGLGMGAVFPLPYAIVSEFVRSRQRTLFNGVMDAFLSIGYFIAPLLGLWILPSFPVAVAWRIFFAVSALPIAFAGIIKLALPESPRWLERNGRHIEAERVMAAIEAEVSRWSNGSFLQHNMMPMAQLQPQKSDQLHENAREESDSTKLQPSRTSVTLPWQAPYRRMTISRSVAAIGTFFMFYIVMTYMPTIFSSKGFSFAHSLLFTAVITAAAIPGKLVNGYLAEHFGRKAMYVVFMGLAGIAALFFGLANTPFAMVAFACVMSLFGTGAFPALKMSYAEQYPTRMRTTGAATVETIGRFFGGVVGSYAIPVLLKSYGLSAGFYVVSFVAISAVLVELAFASETKDATLEQLEQQTNDLVEARA